MDPPNAGLPCKGGLRELCLPPPPGRAMPPWAFVAEPGGDTWLDPAILERMLDADPALRALLSEAVGRDAPAGERLLRKVEAAVDRVFENAVLTDLIARFEAIRPLVARYLIAKAAARRDHPGRFPEPEIGANP